MRRGAPWCLSSFCLRISPNAISLLQPPGGTAQNWTPGHLSQRAEGLFSPGNLQKVLLAALSQSPKTGSCQAVLPHVLGEEAMRRPQRRLPQTREQARTLRNIAAPMEEGRPGRLRSYTTPGTDSTRGGPEGQHTGSGKRSLPREYVPQF